MYIVENKIYTIQKEYLSFPICKDINTLVCHHTNYYI